MVSKETWQKAQKGEINHHVGNFNLNEANKNHYKDIYKNVFKFVDPNFDFDAKNKKILEIGPGVFAALLYCQNVTDSSIVEPLDLPENVKQVYIEKNIGIIKAAVEDLELQQVDEVWVFNVMQHIWNPDVFVAKLKKIAKKILFFEPIGTPLDDLHVHSYTLQDFQRFFGETVTKQFNGGSVPHFHTANCAYGIWDRSVELTKNLGVIGIGKLGLCFALSLEKAGYNVYGVDVSSEYVSSINTKQYKTSEPFVEEYLLSSRNLLATTDLKTAVDFANTFFTVVATPSLPDGKYDHSQLEGVVNKLKEFGVQETKKHLVVCCTVMPGETDKLQKELEPFNWAVSYNPEFIAQGTVIRNQENPDMILIGEASVEFGNQLEGIYHRFCKNSPRIHRMSCLSAEITKIGLNCFLVTKIAYANMIGDLSETIGAETEKILNAIGDDSRVGNKFLKYGFGFGGPCLPRDAKALGMVALENGCYANIPFAADEANKLHLIKQVELLEKSLSSKEEPIYFNSITYKPESILIDESQQLQMAVELAKRGYKIVLNERKEVVEAVKKQYGDLFVYQMRAQEINKKVISFTLFGNGDIYLKGAIENAKLAYVHYPGWECRFYVDQTISQDIKKRLKEEGAIVIEKSPAPGYSGLFWRFEPAKDLNVDAWVSRDADSRLSEKEALAVNEWLASGKTFHIMRDSHNHDLYPIMAGMFGVRNDLLRVKYKNINFVCPNENAHQRDIDQLVLQNQVWQFVQGDHICHEHWAHNPPVSNQLAFMNGRDPNTIYHGQGVHGHVTNRRRNFPQHFSDTSINRPFPKHNKLQYGLYLGQRITEDNKALWNEEVQWEYELRGEKW